MKTAALVACAALLAVSAVVAQETTTTKPVEVKDGIRVTALSIALPDPTDKFQMRSISGAMPAGTSLFLELNRKDKNLLKLDEDATKIDSFKDDKGTDLMPTRSFGRVKGMAPFPQFSADNHTFRFTLNTEKAPANGAKEIVVKGKLTLVVGTDPKTETQKDVPLSADTKLSAGPLTGKIEKVEEQKWGEDTRTIVTMKLDKDIDGLKSMGFIGADGKAIESQLQYSGNMGNSVTKAYAVKGKMEKATIEVIYFTKTEKVEVELNQSVSVGI